MFDREIHQCKIVAIGVISHFSELINGVSDMIMVDIDEAKTNLTKYISALNEQEDEIIIQKNGKPVAKLIPFQPSTSKRIGEAKGILPTMKDLQEFNDITTQIRWWE